METKETWKSIEISQITKSQLLTNMSPDAKLVYILAGQVELLKDNQRTNFSLGEFFLIPNFSKITVKLKDIQTRAYLINLAYTPSSDNNDVLSVFQGNSKRMGEAVNSTLSTSLQKLLKLYYLNHDDASYWEVGSLYFQIINKLEKKYLIQQNKSKDLLTKENLILYLTNHITDDISVKEVARQFFVSNQTISRFFKKEFGKSLGKYIQEKRLKRVKEGLVETNEPINSLAYTAGFKNLNSFNRIFKNTYGISPSKYRATNAKENTKVRDNIEEYYKADFTNFDTSIFEKVSHHTYSALTSKNYFSSRRIWNIQKVDSLLNLYQLKKVLNFIEIETIRFPIDLVKLSENQYLTIMSELAKLNIELHFRIDITDRVLLTKFFEKLLKHFGIGFLSKITVEVCEDTSNKDFLNYYSSFYDILKNRFGIKRCGLGNFTFLGNRPTYEALAPCINQHNKIDFLSFNAVPHIKKDSNYSLRKNIVDQSHLDNVFANIKEEVLQIHKSFGTETPLLLSEFNLTADFTDPINDHLYLASYYLAFIEQMEPLFEAIGYLSLLEETDYSENLFSGNPGLIVANTLPKAVIFAEQFKQRLPKKLIGYDKNLYISSDVLGKYEILTYNYQPINDYYTSSKKMDLYHYQNYIFNSQRKVFQLNITNVPNGTYRVTFCGLNQENGSGPTVLNKYSGLKQLSDDMIEFISHQFRPILYQKEITVQDNEISEKIILNPSEIESISYELIDN